MKKLKNIPAPAEGCEREKTTAAKLNGKGSVEAGKIMVLAVQKQDWKLVITPIDIEHEQDDQTELCTEEKIYLASQPVAEVQRRLKAQSKNLAAKHTTANPSIQKEVA